MVGRVYEQVLTICTGNLFSVFNASLCSSSLPRSNEQTHRSSQETQRRPRSVSPTWKVTLYRAKNSGAVLIANALRCPYYVRCALHSSGSCTHSSLLGALSVRDTNVNSPCCTGGIVPLCSGRTGRRWRRSFSRTAQSGQFRSLRPLSRKRL